MFEYNYDVQLANDDGPFAETQARLVYKGKGRIPLWKGSCQLTDIALAPGGAYQIILPDDRCFDFVVDSCEALGADKCIVTFTVREDIGDMF
jgi:hypothetical protein